MSALIYYKLGQAGALNAVGMGLPSMQKEAIYETVRAGLKAGRQALFGGTHLTAPTGVFQAERQVAVGAGNSLMQHLQGSGLNVHRARVKSPGSLTAGGHTTVPNDLLGMQAYGRGPEDIARIQQQLTAAGATIHGSKPVVRSGYHGVNIKGTHQNVPFEFQVSPGRMSNMGNIMEHTLAYKPLTEAPRSNFIDRWFGKQVAPKMVSSSSWVPNYSQQLRTQAVHPAV